MQPRRLLPLAAIAAIGLLGGAGATSAHTLVDPTTLTTPLPPTRFCFEDGPWVKCDTSAVITTENEDTGDPGCGIVYLDSTDTRHATRWYRDGLLVERIVQSQVRGNLSLSPGGTSKTVDLAANLSWVERFLVPGDLSSAAETVHGNVLRIEGMGSLARDVGIWLPDGTHHGLFSLGDEGDAALCALLVQ
jgi:hypothetical protein